MATGYDPQTVISALFAERYGETIEDWIAARRSEGVTWRAMAPLLAEHTDGLIDVSYSTLVNWHKRTVAA